MDMIDGDTDEPLKRRIERHSFDRLIMLSDGVFAIAITLAALEIRPPDRWHDLPGLIAQLRFPVLAYLISFAVVASYWVATALIVPAFFTWIAITGESLAAAPMVGLAALLLMRRLILPLFGERRRASAVEATTSSRL